MKVVWVMAAPIGQKEWVCPKNCTAYFDYRGRRYGVSVSEAEINRPLEELLSEAKLLVELEGIR